MSTVYYTSDFHLGHEKIAQMRGFDTVAEHDAAILDRWRETVGPRDIVHLLGDMTGGGKIDEMLETVAALPGIKHLVPGNHCPVHPSNRRAARWQRRYLEVFESVQPFARHKIGGHDVLLSHFPYTEDHTETPRYTQYRLADEDRWLLHGHTHSPRKVSSPREIHVGVDAWDFAPAAREAIAAIIASPVSPEH